MTHHQFSVPPSTLSIDGETSLFLFESHATEIRENNHLVWDRMAPSIGLLIDVAVVFPENHLDILLSANGRNA